MRIKRIQIIAVLLLSASIVPIQADGQTVIQEAVRRDTLVEASIVVDRIISKPTYIIRPQEIHGTISALGEPDAIKYIQTLPGVSSGIEGTSSFYVRGGNMGNNLITIDGVTIYGPSHLMGFSSILPSSVIGRTDFFVGGFTSEDGNLLSSHVKMTSKSGDFRNFHTQLSLSNVMASAMFSTPIVREKLSLIVSGRWSPAALEYNALSGKIDPSLGLPERIGLGVYDIYAKLHYMPSSHHDISLSFFNSGDSYSYSIKDENGSIKSSDQIKWGNMIGILSWKWKISDSWTLRTGASYNSFSSDQLQERKLRQESKYIQGIALKSRITEAKFNMMAQYSGPKGLKIQFGTDIRNSGFNPGSYTTDTLLVIDNYSSNLLIGAHAQISYSKDGKYNLRASFRGNWFKSGDYSRIMPEVRLYADCFFNRYIGLEFTADYLSQYYHTLEGIPTGLSLDMIIPSGTYADPERAAQVYLGLFSRFGEGFRFSLGGFYKEMYGLVFFQDAASFFTSSAAKWKDNLDIGSGTSYGLEFLAQKGGERFNAKIAYTYSKTERTYPRINNGKPIPFKFDRTHVLNTNASYLFGKSNKLEHGMTVSFTLTSGHYETLSAGSYPGYMPFDEKHEPMYSFFKDMTYYTHPNNYRIPLYIRLDAGYNFKIKRRTCSHDISIGVFNVLNRHNAYSLSWDSDAQKWKQLSILPIMPSINYTFEF